MKRLIYIITLLFFSFTVVFAQNEVDALRYSLTFYGGTARAVSMGGAFGALGGDFSAISYNPAGIGVYRSTELTFSPSLFYDNTSSNYLNSTFEDYKYNFNINNFGFVTTFKTNNDEGWVSTSLALGYNKLNNFNSRIRIEGICSNSSMLDYFASNATGYSEDNLYAFDEALAWETYLIDTVTGGIYEYATVLSLYGDAPESTYGQNQRRTINTKGSMGEYIIAFGANYSHKLYLGATFGYRKLRYVEHSEQLESNFDDDSSYAEILDLESFKYIQDLETRGQGYTFKLGFIYKPIDMLRIGGAIHLPTFYDLKDEYYTSLEANFAAGDSVNPPNIYAESPFLEYDYSLTTPFKAIGSVALKIKKIALLSFDYEFIDYSTIRLRNGGDGYDFLDENDILQDCYKKSANIRTGAEVRLGPISLRGGYAFYGSPYRSSEVNKNANYSSFSGGIGFREKNVFFDIAYVNTIHNERYYLYNHYLHDGAKFNSNDSKVLVTLGFKF